MTDFQDIYDAAEIRISRYREREKSLPSDDYIKKCVKMSADYLEISLSSEDFQLIVIKLQQVIRTIIGPSSSIIEKNWQVWVSSKRADISWDYWDRYKKYLRKKGWARQTVDKIDEATDEILDYLYYPATEGPWDRRGLVVGHVQSGKTANYTGLVCKAADAGYKVIIILAGMQESLRNQTQVRIDEGFIGRFKDDDRKWKTVGVGKIPSGKKLNTDRVTTRLSDFGKKFSSQVGHNLNENPLIFVVKKNGHVLKNLIKDWIGLVKEEGQDCIRNTPLLLIDDEADQASINTSDPDDNPSRINERIRTILASFEQSAYIAYTATPFANIFIGNKMTDKTYGDDLFPRSFIVNIPVPTNYFGPEVMFGFNRNGDPSSEENDLPFFEFVSDCGDQSENDWMPLKHKSNHIPRFENKDHVPPSLRSAILDFIIVCAARICRGHKNVHNSMLVHVTLFKDVQTLVTEQVKRELGDIVDVMKIGKGGSSTDVVNEMKQKWEQCFIPGTKALEQLDCPEIPWTKLSKNLLRAAQAIKVKKVNGDVPDPLQYDRNKEAGLNVIAVGGNKLSRGLTLEGLSISYFLRRSKMYDSLMQMGRWFGYRPGYLDLCRLYTSEELVNWFRHITLASTELREEFDRMASLNQTPVEYGQRVLSHPQMMVTSKLKMKNGTSIPISFQGTLPQTTKIFKSNPEVMNNHKAVLMLLKEARRLGLEEGLGIERSSLKGKRTWEKYRFWEDVPCTAIVNFLKIFQTHPLCQNFNRDRIIDYVQVQNNEIREKELLNWSIALAGGRGKEMDFGSNRIHCVDRIFKEGKVNVDIKKRKRQDVFQTGTIVSPDDEGIDIKDPDKYEEALYRTIIERKRKDKDVGPRTKPVGWSYRVVRPATNGLLLIYPIDPKEYSDVDDVPLYALAISFPGSDKAKPVNYVVNQTYYESTLEPDDEVY